ncbi:hypothetical protein HZA39_03230 [Candidatus Peregrinibacteria bacterium]|nr:hypothetical protein [Candidatus Peregrinibacteria bacterium]
MLNKPKNCENLPEFDELRDLLGESFENLILSKGDPINIKKEIFQSNTFIEAGYIYLPERYGKGDRSLYTVKYQDGHQVFVVTGKVSSKNPFEVGYTADAGLDLRKNFTVVYIHDGEQKISEIPIGRKDECNTYEVELNYLIEHIRKNLGTAVQ